ncbi:MAG: TIGR03905 family TSCPD domain-containing protein [Clostridia bacterium]|nr:TIGR03905 family TSCPD domain-containing protein [Clostridia bacterium]
MNTYRPRGVCSQNIQFDVAEDGTIHHVSFMGGCNGNLQGIGALVEGMELEEAIRRLSGIKCGWKETSCPDQLAQALAKYREEHL